MFSVAGDQHVGTPVKAGCPEPAAWPYSRIVKQAGVSQGIKQGNVSGLASLPLGTQGQHIGEPDTAMLAARHPLVRKDPIVHQPVHVLPRHPQHLRSLRRGKYFILTHDDNTFAFGDPLQHGADCLVDLRVATRIVGKENDKPVGFRLSIGIDRIKSG